MKKYIFAIMICLINYVLIKGIIYCWNSIPVMPTDKLATMMTYFTFLLYIIQVIVVIKYSNIIGFSLIILLITIISNNIVESSLIIDIVLLILSVFIVIKNIKVMSSK